MDTSPPDLRNPLGSSRMWEMMATYLSRDPVDIQQYICNHVEYTLARTRFNIEGWATYMATALSVRDRLIESWNDTQQVELFSAGPGARAPRGVAVCSCN